MKPDDPEDKKGLTDEQKKKLIIAGAVTATAFIAGYAAYKVHKDGGFKSLISKGTELWDVDTETGFPKIKDSDWGIDKINKYNLLDRGTTMNCGNSTIAMELRKRGLDVKATKNETGMTLNQLAQYFDLRGSNAVQTVDWDENYVNSGAGFTKITKELQDRFKDGGRGALLVPHRYGSHFVGFEVKNGKVDILDGQNPNPNMVKMLFDMVDTRNNPIGRQQGGISVVRLDNAKINTNRIREMVEPVSQKFKKMERLKNISSDKFNVERIYGDNFVLNDYTKAYYRELASYDKRRSYP